MNPFTNQNQRGMKMQNMQRNGRFINGLAGIIFMALSVLLPSLVLAVSSGIVQTGAQKFEIDGDLICGNSTLPNGPGADWAPGIASCTTITTATTTPIFIGAGPTEPPPTNPNEIAAARFQDPAFSSTDKIFSSGSKQDNTSTWIRAIQKPPVKVDIGNVYTLGRTDGSSLVAILGFERLSSNGNSHLDYELNQLPFVTNIHGTPVPNRCAGMGIPEPSCQGPDIIIAIDDGTTVIPNVRIFEWNGSTFVQAATSTAILAATNPTAIAAGPWGTFNSKGKLVYGTTSILKDTFSEVAIDLATIAGVNASCPGGFASVFIKSRSSESITSELKDLIDPVPFGLDTCGMLTIKKMNTSDPNNIVLLAGATFLIAPNPNTGLDSLIVTDGGANDPDGVADGIINFNKAVPTTYTVVETAAPNGFILETSSQTCVVANDGKGVCDLTFNNHGMPDLSSVHKTANPVSGSTVVSGQAITYTVTAANTGNAPALNTVITDTVDTRLTNVVPLNGGVFNPVDRVVTWMLGDVAINQTISVAFTATVVSPLANATILNQATITFAQGSLSTNVTEHIVGPSVLSITKMVDKATASPGEHLLYTLSYSNTGSGDATGVVISDTLPANTTFVSATGGGVYATTTNTVTWDIGTVSHGSTGSVTFTVQLDAVFPNGTTNVVNSAVMQSTELPPTPSNPVTTVVGAMPNLSLLKAVDKATASPSETLIYTLTYTNSGNADASAVTISDTLPAKTTFVSATGGGVYATTTNTVTWDIGTVAANGGTGSVSFTVQLDAVFPNGTTNVVNSAVIQSAELPPTPSNPVTTVVTAAPNLSLIKAVDKVAASPSETLIYTLTYTNSGNADASAVTISDTLPANTTFVSATGGGVYAMTTNTVTWDIGTVAANGGTGFVTFTVQLGAVFPNGTTNVVNSAVIQSTELPPTPSNPVTTVVTATRTLTILKVLASAITQRTIDLTNSATVTSTDAAGAQTSLLTTGAIKGTDIVYTITVENTGNSAASDVVITDTLPAGSHFVSASNGGTLSGIVVTWVIGTVNAGTSSSVTLTIRVGE